MPLCIIPIAVIRLIVLNVPRGIIFIVTFATEMLPGEVPPLALVASLPNVFIFSA